MAGIERLETVDKQASEATPCPMTFQHSGDVVRKHLSTQIGVPVMEPEIMKKPQIVTALHSPEFVQQHHSAQRLDF